MTPEELLQYKKQSKALEDTWLGTWKAKPLPFYFCPRNFDFKKRCWKAKYIYCRLTDYSNRNRDNDDLCYHFLHLQKFFSNNLFQWAKRRYAWFTMKARAKLISELCERNLSNDLIRRILEFLNFSK